MKVEAKTPTPNETTIEDIEPGTCVRINGTYFVMTTLRLLGSLYETNGRDGKVTLINLTTGLPTSHGPLFADFVVCETARVVID